MESESTTLNARGTLTTLKNSINANGGVGGILKSKFVLPWKRRQINRLRSASPPKPNLKLCTENYIVYSWEISKNYPIDKC